MGLNDAFKWNPVRPSYELDPDAPLKNYLANLETRMTLLEENIKQMQATFDRWAPYLDKLSSTYNALEIEEELDNADR